jgi:outer membrane protein OmpA-like peptidoglycan-associated protein
MILQGTQSGLAVVSLLFLVTGCGSTRPDLNPMASEVARLQDEIQGLSADSTSAAFLDHSKALSRQSETARAGDQWDAASRALTEARSAGRVALTAAMAHRWQEEADGCRRATAETGREWQDAVRVLEQVEKVAGRQARGVVRTVPEIATGQPLPKLIARPTNERPDPVAIGEASQAWKMAAHRYYVPTADLDGAVISAVTLAESSDIEESVRDHQLRLAVWAVLELGYRVRGEAARLDCADALTDALELANYRDRALWAMVDLERSMKEGARNELEEERQRLADREQALYESLKQFEGKFASIRREARGTILSLSDILFDFGKAELRRDAELNLAKVAVILQQYPEMKILVEGHTDNVGSEKYNVELSEERAAAVYTFLGEQGVSGDRLETKGYGFSQPMTSNATPEGRQQNRRVDLVIRGE